jgi:hypothetical protein
MKAVVSTATSKDGPHRWCMRYLPRVSQQRLLSCLYEWVRTPVAFPTEVIIIDGPEHDATQAVLADVPRLWSIPVLQYQKHVQTRR